MKKIKSLKGILAAAAALLLALALWAGFTPPVSVSDAAYYPTGDYTITAYTVEYDVSEKLAVSVTEVFTVEFRKRAGIWDNDLHGVIRDFPLGSGVRYRNLKAVCDHPDFSPSLHTDDSDYMSYYLRGDGTVYGESRTYTLTYEMLLPKPDGSVLSFNPIGYGWMTEINNVTCTIIVPQGVTLREVYSGDYRTEADAYTDGGVQNGNQITVRADRLPRAFYDGEGNLLAAGITVDLNFGKGVFSYTPDLTVLYIVLIGAAIIAGAVLLKLFALRQPALVRTVNLDAPEQMDPLRMGKLIDNSIDSEDIGSLVFWLASKDYLTIDLSGSQDDPTLIRSDKEIEPDMPAHCRIFFEGLFSNRISVRISELGNSFYKTTEQVKAAVSATVTKPYDKKSGVFFGLFWLLSVLLLGGFLFLYALAAVGGGYLWWVGFVTCLFGFIAGAVGTNFAAQRYYKWKKWKIVLSVLAGVAVGMLAALVGMLFPSAAFTRVTSLIAAALATAAGAVAGSFSRRTPEYNEKLGQILGFKQFILFTERDKIEFMLKENPELYYKILPYAQVLGVTDAWTEKFKGLDMKAPAYVRYSGTDFLFDYLLWRTVFRTMNTSLAHNLV
ncbi:MAG: DUF2207 domain-containing protein, partial [Clostridia bacterium]|nr:DUF2207 domain-containing protein [Clostridia bacterium]